MPELIIRLDREDGNFSDVALGKKLIHVTNPIHLTAARAGMSSGRASVALGFVVGGNKFVLAETSLKLFLTGAAALAGKFPEEARDIPFFAQAEGNGKLKMVMQPTRLELSYAIERLELDESPASEGVISFLKSVLAAL
ncbi:MAG TPA: hypothetical protein VF762_14315 [Blastocatellia bacterium]|jgi:hypothetical protein